MMEDEKKHSVNENNEEDATSENTDVEQYQPNTKPDEELESLLDSA